MKSLLPSRASRALAALYLAVFLVILILTALTPLLADDYSYCFSWADNSRVTSPLQIPASMAAHRQVTNGRVVSHALVQLVLMAPKLVFNLLNAGAAVLLLRLMDRFFRERKARQRLLLTLIGALLLFNEMPSFGQVALWLDGAINYSWGIVLFLLFLWPYAALWLGKAQKRGLPRDLGFLLLALLVGAYSENGSLATLFAAACLTLLSALREKKLRWRPLAGLGLGALGYVFLMTAPATRGRGAGLSFSALAQNFKRIAAQSREALLPLFLLFAIALALCLLFRADRKKLILAVILFLAGLGSLASFIFARYFVPRHFCFTVYFTVLACLLLLSALLEKERPVLPALTAAVLAVLFVFNFAQGALDVAVTHQHARQREAQIRAALEAGETEVHLPLYEPATRYSAAQLLDDLNTEESNIWPNWSVADYYGIDAVLGIPPEDTGTPAN
jgi:hypothetical protein